MSSKMSVSCLDRDDDNDDDDDERRHIGQRWPLLRDLPTPMARNAAKAACKGEAPES